MNSKCVAIIGGSCSGKTTLIEFLSEKGYATLPEAAQLAINRLTQEMGASALATWCPNHIAEFQSAIAKMQAALEMGVTSTCDSYVFCDGALLDPLGYCRYFNATPTLEHQEITAAHHYHAIFALESLEVFTPRLKAGRVSDKESSCLIGQILRQVYTEAGYSVVDVPRMLVEDRASFILERLNVL